jgi:FKBP-type peptidyl-prolyl cis-trans isomerase FklB
MKTSILIGLILFCLPLNCFADDPAPMDTMDKINYSVGHQIGGDFLKQDVEMREEALVQGIRDALQSNPPRMKKGEMRQMLLDLKKMVIEANKADRERYRGEGREFLQANAEKQGVVTLESGLQYKIIKEGNGRQPDISDFVLVDYRGTRLDGAEFDSSYRDGKPLKIQVAKVIPGWTEALQLMKEGAEWQLFIPADLAYGERGPLADQTVLYDIKLIQVSPE